MKKRRNNEYELLYRVQQNVVGVTVAVGTAAYGTNNPISELNYVNWLYKTCRFIVCSIWRVCSMIAFYVCVDVVDKERRIRRRLESTTKDLAIFIWHEYSATITAIVSLNYSTMNEYLKQDGSTKCKVIVNTTTVLLDKWYYSLWFGYFNSIEIGNVISLCIHLRRFMCVCVTECLISINA